MMKVSGNVPPTKERIQSILTQLKHQSSPAKKDSALPKDKNSFNDSKVSPKGSVPSFHNGTSAELKTQKPSKELMRKVDRKDSSSSESDDELRNCNHTIKCSLLFNIIIDY